MILYANHTGERRPHPFPFLGGESSQQIDFDNKTPYQYLSIVPDPVEVRDDAHFLLKSQEEVSRRKTQSRATGKIRRGFAVQIERDGARFLATGESGTTTVWPSCNKGKAEKMRDELVADGTQARVVRVRFCEPEVL